MTKLLVVENNNLMTSIPKSLKAFYLFLTLPVTVASAEKLFLKLKLMKSYLRNTMSQLRLNGLAKISIDVSIDQYFYTKPKLKKGIHNLILIFTYL